MQTGYEIFKALHNQNKPLILANAWDVRSAKLSEENGYQAVATSSWAIADMLGYEDGENMSFDELLFVVKRIAASINIPLTVDIETGYSNDIEQVIVNIEALIAAGVVGINLEDSANKALEPAEQFASKIKAIKTKLVEKNKNIFINARTDSYLVGHPSPMEESSTRAKLYEEAGADGLFVPFTVAEGDIANIVKSTNLPVNVLATKGILSVEALTKLGVKRISTGANFYRATYAKASEIIKAISGQGSFDALF